MEINQTNKQTNKHTNKQTNFSNFKTQMKAGVVRNYRFVDPIDFNILAKWKKLPVDRPGFLKKGGCGPFLIVYLFKGGSQAFCIKTGYKFSTLVV